MNGTRPHRAMASTAAAAILGLLSSCRFNLDWTPRGMAEFDSYYSDAGVYGTDCVVYVRLINTGESVISKSTYTVRVDTDRHRYWQTTENDTRIKPGTRVMDEVSIALSDPDETVKADGVKVMYWFFE